MLFTSFSVPVTITTCSTSLLVLCMKKKPREKNHAYTNLYCNNGIFNAFIKNRYNTVIIVVQRICNCMTILGWDQMTSSGSQRYHLFFINRREGLFALCRFLRGKKFNPKQPHYFSFLPIQNLWYLMAWAWIQISLTGLRKGFIRLQNYRGVLAKTKNTPQTSMQI